MQSWDLRVPLYFWIRGKKIHSKRKINVKNSAKSVQEDYTEERLNLINQQMKQRYNIGPIYIDILCIPCLARGSGTSLASFNERQNLNFQWWLKFLNLIQNKVTSPPWTISFPSDQINRRVAFYNKTSTRKIPFSMEF